MKNRLILLALTISLLALTSCGGGGGNDSTSTPTISRGSLSSSTLLATKSASFLIPYSVNAYKVVYNTIDVNGKAIKASGLLSIPNKASNEKSPILSYQHGTIFLDAAAPSNSSTSVNAIMTLAGTGYIVSAADFIGYGESVGTIHPYLHAESLASASIDMLRASHEFLQSKNIKTNNQLFLTGYSEGGYATLALHKIIQEQHVNEFPVTASAAGAGPFDLTETTKTIANKTINEEPAYMSFLLKAYDSAYSLNKVSEMYQSQYITAINTVFDGQNSQSTINDKLNTVTAELFNGAFLNALQGSANHEIKEKLALNNIYDWKPTSPTRFYHSQNDETVPYSNAQKALTTMKENGATDVSLGDCPLDTHVQCAVPYVLDTLGFFSDYAEDL